MNKRNLLAVFGLVYVLVWLVGLVIPTGTLAATMSNAEIQQVLLAHQQSRMIQVLLIDGIAGICILLFAVAAAGMLQQPDDKNTMPVHVVLGAGIAAGAISLAQAGVQQTLVNPDLLAFPDTPFRVLLVLVNQIDTFKLMALALLSLAIALPALRTRVLPAWMGWLGVALSAALVLGGLSFAVSVPALTYVLFASLPMLLVWVGAVSVAMLRKNG